MTAQTGEVALRVTAIRVPVHFHCLDVPIKLQSARNPDFPPLYERLSRYCCCVPALCHGHGGKSCVRSDFFLM